MVERLPSWREAAGWFVVTLITLFIWTLLQPFITYVIDYMNSVVTNIPYPSFKITWPALNATGIVALAVAGLIAYAILRSSRSALFGSGKPTSTYTEKGFKFFHDRDSLPPLKEWILEAKSEIIYVGGDLKAIADIQGVLIKAIEKGVTIKLIMLPDTSYYLKSLTDAQGLPEYNVAEETKNTLKILCDVKRKKLQEKDRNKLQLRVNNLHPLYTIAIRDGETDDGLIRIEPFIYKSLGVSVRPSFMYSKKKRPEEFAKYWNGYLYVLERSTEYICEE